MSFLFWMECRECHALNKIEARKRYVMDEAAGIFVPCLFPVEDEGCYRCGKALARKNRVIKYQLQRVVVRGLAGRNCFV